MPALTTDLFLHDLASTLPAEARVLDSERMRVFECDALSAYQQLPLAVVLPADEAQLLQTLALCRKYRVPVVARGAGTGLSGGALPVAGGILLSLSRMNRLLEVDPLGRHARVQPGVRNLAISEAAAPHGLYYAPDPSSQIACSIGGNVAENAGGVHCLKYGLTLHNLLALRVVTIDGEVLALGGTAPDAPGLDLLPLLTGSEGLLGFITEVTVKLLPKPPLAKVIMAAFPTVDFAADAVAALIASGIIPAGVEMMDQATVKAVTPLVGPIYPVDAAAVVLVEADGSEAEVAGDIDRMLQILQANGASQLALSSSEAERLQLWAGRKAAFPAAARLAPDYYCMDGSIPRQQLGRILQEIEALSAEFGLACINVFHAGDGNLHPLILFDANAPGQFERTEAFGARILEACVALGGAITGEHGVGVEKIQSMCVQFSRAELTCFHRLKQAFDADGLLNPGKAIPELHRCAEHGRLHVHGGQLPFPDLPRF